MEDFRLSLHIKIPKIECECDMCCICKQFIKCRNDCFCGNKILNTQPRSQYSALTPDYRFKKMKRSDSKVLFGDEVIFKINRTDYHSPRYFKTIDINRKFRIGNLTPQYIKNNFDRVRTPGSV
jgi:hypothetical protein